MSVSDRDTPEIFEPFPAPQRSSRRYRKSARSKSDKSWSQSRSGSWKPNLPLQQFNFERNQDANLCFQFRQAVKRGHHQRVISLLNQMPDNIKPQLINKLPVDGLAPFHFAVRCGDRRLVQLLLQNGADVHLVGEEKMQAIHYATKFCSHSQQFHAVHTPNSFAEGEWQSKTCLEMLLEYGADPNAQDMFRTTPLHYACARGHVDAVKTLFELKTLTPCVCDENRSSILHQAAKYGHVEIVSMLLSCEKTKRNLLGFQDVRGSTPLILACRNGHTQVVGLLLAAANNALQNGALQRLLDRDNRHKTALHAAVRSGNCDTVEIILQFWEKEIERSREDNCAIDGKNHSYVDFQTIDGYTALHIAATTGSMDILRAICQKKPQLDAVAKNNQTPVYAAACYSHLDCLEFLLKQGSNFELADDELNTPLLIACKKKHVEAVKILLKYNANVFAADIFCQNSLFSAVRCGSIELVEALLSVADAETLLLMPDREDNTALHQCASFGNIAIMKLLHSRGLNINSRNATEATPLHMAAKFGQCDIIKAIVSEDKESLHQVDDHSRSPLHFAARSGQLQAVTELLSFGAKTTEIDVYGYTPLHMSIEHFFLECTKVLLDADPSVVNSRTRSQETPLHLACRSGCADTVELLLGMSININARILDGRTAISLAIDCYNKPCVLAIFCSPLWEDALRNAYKHQDVLTTPFRQLIRTMPDVAELVLGKCITCGNQQNGVRSDGILEAKFNYEFLEDAYTILKWADSEEEKKPSDIPKQFLGKPDSNDLEMGSLNNTAVHELGKQSNKDGIEPEEEVHIVQNTKKRWDSDLYSNEVVVLSNNHPLAIMTKEKRENLLRNPVVKSFLIYKWEKSGLIIYTFGFLSYIVFALLLSVSLCTLPPPYAVDGNRTIINSTGQVCVRVIPEAESDWGNDCLSADISSRLIVFYIIIFYSGFQLCKKVFQLYHWRFGYFKDPLNFTEVGLYIASILVFLNFDFFSEATGIRLRWQWELGAYVIILTWINMIFHIRHTRFGIYVFMVASVFTSFMQFAPIVLVFILGFSFSFFVLLQNVINFTTPWFSLLRTFVMVLGEFEFFDFLNSDPNIKYNERASYQFSTLVIFFAFVVVVSLVLANLLVGIAVDDIALVYDRAQLKQLEEQVRNYLGVENILPRFLRRRMICMNRTVRINSRGSQRHLRKLLLDNLNFDEDLINGEKEKKRLGERSHSTTDTSEIQTIIKDMESVKKSLQEFSSVIMSMKNRGEKAD